MFLFRDGLFTLIYCFCDSSDYVEVLLPHNTEVVNGGTMTSDVKMVIYLGGGLKAQMFFMTPLYIHHHIPPYQICMYR